MRRAMDTMVVLVLVAGLVGACSDDGAERGEDGRIRSGGDLSVFDLQVGDCVEFRDDLEPEVERMPVVPCEEPHNGEVFALVELEELDAYPGERELSDLAERECISDFADYVGVDLADSTLFPTTAIPSIRSWQEDGDRTVVCFALTAGEPTTGSVKDSGR